MRQRVTVVPDSKIIIVDGDGLWFDFDAPAGVNALQWRNDTGHVEYTDGRQNIRLTQEDYPSQVQPFVELWEAEKARLEAIANAPPTLEEAKEAKRQEIIAQANAMSSTIKARYSVPEIDTFPDQKTEAYALLADEAAAAPNVRDLAANRGIPVMDFARRIIANVEAAAAATMAIVKQQQTMEDAAKNAVSVGAVQAITVTYQLEQGA